MNNLENEIRNALNRYSAENGSNTPDFILAQYLLACLAAFDVASARREQWYGYAMRPGLGVVSLTPVEPPDEEPPQP